MTDLLEKSEPVVSEPVVSKVSIARSTILRDACAPGDRQVRPADGCCLKPDLPIKRPDPAIYSQMEELAAGRVPDWNSPDITTNTWNNWHLLEEIIVRVSNRSTETSCANAVVRLLTSEFGIGLARSEVSARTVSLHPGSAIDLNFPLAQSFRDQRTSIGTHVEIRHPTDSNPENNYGEQVITGLVTGPTGGSKELTFPVRNALNAPQNITLAILSSQLSAALTWTARNFASFEQVDATLSVQLPGAGDLPAGENVRRDVTIAAFGEGNRLIGGLSWVIRIDT